MGTTIVSYHLTVFGLNTCTRYGVWTIYARKEVASIFRLLSLEILVQCPALNSRPMCAVYFPCTYTLLRGSYSEALATSFLVVVLLDLAGSSAGLAFDLLGDG